MIICLALLGKSMNEIEKNEFLKMELETDTYQSFKIFYDHERIWYVNLRL